MLIAAGPGVAALKSYSHINVASSFQAQSQQGTTLDTLSALLHDRTNSATIVAEDDIVALDENDPSGWPTVNLLANPGLQGTFVSGVAPSWTAPTLTGYTPSQNTASAAPAFGHNASQQLVMSNAANGSTAQLYQTITLPQDETTAPLAAYPYYASIYAICQGAAVAIAPVLALQFYAADGVTLLGQATATLPTVVGATWQRYVVSATPPAGTVFARVAVLLTTSGAANSYIVLLDAAQLEYATFSAYSVPITNPTSLLNSYLTGTLGAGVATSWYPDSSGASGVTYALVSAPAISTSAQQIQATAVAPSSSPRSVAQNLDLMNGLWSYTLTLSYIITAPFSSAARIQLGAVFLDEAGNTLWSVSAQSASGLVVTGGWQTLTLGIGPAYGMTGITLAETLKVYAGFVDPTDASINGTVVIGALTLTPYAANPDVTTALTAQVYPTPYCDAGQPGCYTDMGRSGLTYRHLRVFGGFVKAVDTDLTNGPEPQRTLHAVEYGTLLAEAPATLNIAQQSDVSAIAAACAYAVTLGYLVGLDYTTFVTGVDIIDAQSFAQATVRDVLNYIANQTIAAYYVDPYCRLHYGSALAVSAPFNLSDTPDGVTTFPYTAFVHTSDGTQTVTEPVIEGGPQTSAPQTYTGSGANATLSAGLTSGNVYTALTVNATSVAIPSGSALTINLGGGTTQQVTTSAAVAAGATSIPVASFTANATYAAATPVAIATTFSIFNGAAVEFVDAVTAASVSQSVGLASNDTLGAAGITALYAPNTGTVQLLTALGATQSISVTFRFSAPVMLRLHNVGASTSGGSVGRKIFQHTTHSAIRSKQSALDRATADSRQYSKARAVATLTVTTPPTPSGTPLRVGAAIAVTNQIVGWNALLLQIQQVTTALGGNGKIYRTLQLGFYRPDAIVLLAQSRRESATITSQVSSDTILQDVLSVADGWAVTDSLRGTVTNVGTWNGASTWSGTSVWG